MGAAIPDTVDFARCMALLGPFESSPHVAVAVSGGGDSMALALLVADWVRGNGGRLTAMTVDHGLRSESGDEALRVGRWLKGRGIEHRILNWRGVKPATGIQAAARAARYRLLTAACREAGILHLMTAHHLQDQAETFLLRLARSSGIDGLAAMSAVVEKDGIRLLRPLLQTPKQRLREILTAAAQDWIEDPSNDDRSYARVRIRQSFPDLTAAGLTAVALTATAVRMARARVALEAAASALLGRCAFVHPGGYIMLDGRALFDAPDEISLRALSRALMCGGGGHYRPSMPKLENLQKNMKAYFITGDGWKGATLARCRVTPCSLPGSAAAFLVYREMRNLPAYRTMPEGAGLRWDRRFDLFMQGPLEYSGQDKNHSKYKDLLVGPLGRQGLRQIRDAPGGALPAAIPAAALWAVPALFDDAGVVQAPHLKYTRRSRQGGPAARGGFVRAVFSPAHSLSGAGFAIAE